MSTRVANSSMRDGTSCINLQQHRLPLHLKEDVLSDPVNSCMEEGHGFARCYTQVCGDSVQGDHSGSLPRFEGDPDVCSWIQSLDVMEITQKDYDNICVSSMNHPK